MPTDKSVIDALTTAVDNDPQNSALRLHLASMLAENAMFDEALRHAQLVLSHDPTNLEGLKQAAHASEKLGDLAKAASYRKLVAALDTSSEPARKSSLGKDDWDDVIEETPIGQRKPIAQATDEFSESPDDFIVDVEYSD